MKTYDRNPWVMWEPEMWIKTAVRQHAKYLRLSPELAMVTAVDGAAESGDLDFASMVIDGQFTSHDDVSEAVAKAIDKSDEKPIDTSIKEKPKPEPVQQTAAKTEPEKKTVQAEPSPAENTSIGKDDTAVEFSPTDIENAIYDLQVNLQDCQTVREFTRIVGGFDALMSSLDTAQRTEARALIDRARIRLEGTSK